MNLRQPSFDTRGFVVAITGCPELPVRRRTAIDDRDDLIYHRHRLGWSVADLADVHRLSEKRVVRIVMERARMERRA